MLCNDLNKEYRFENELSWTKPQILTWSQAVNFGGEVVKSEGWWWCGLRSIWGVGAGLGVVVRPSMKDKSAENPL